MAKSLNIAYFGGGSCDKCLKNDEDMISVTFDDDSTDDDATTYTFCQTCIQDAIGDAVNDGIETQMLSARAAG